MDNKNYKDIYDHKLPLDFYKEWTAIESKMKEKKKRRALIWIFSGIGVAICSLIMIPLLSKSDSIHSHNNMEQSEMSLKQKVSSNEVASVIDLKGDNLNENIVRTNEEIQQETATQKSIKLSLQEKGSPTPRVVDSPFIKTANQEYLYSATSIHKDIYDSKLINLSKTTEGNDKSETANLAQIAHIEALVRTNEELYNRQEDKITLNKLPTINAYLAQLIEKKIIPLEKDISTRIIDRNALAKRHSIHIMGSGGLAFRSLGINDENQQYANLRSATETVLDAYQVQLGYAYSINDHWQIASGFNIGTIVEKLNYQNEVQISGYEEGAMIGTYTNHNGTTENLLGNLDYNRVYSIDVTRYNSANTIAIPLSLSYNTSLSRYSFSISTGASIPIYTSYKGKIVDTDRLPIDISEIKDLTIYNNIKINHGIGMEYRLHSNLSVLTGVRFEYDLGNRFDIQNVKQSYSSIMFQLGLSYKW